MRTLTCRVYVAVSERGDGDGDVLVEAALTGCFRSSGQH